MGGGKTNENEQEWPNGKVFETEAEIETGEFTEEKHEKSANTQRTGKRQETTEYQWNSLDGWTKKGEKKC